MFAKSLVQNFLDDPRIFGRFQDIPTRFGLRHRAAIGITEKSDAVCLVVSEETGKTSYIKDGEFVLYENTFSLIETLKSDLT